MFNSGHKGVPHACSQESKLNHVLCYNVRTHLIQSVHTIFCNQWAKVYGSRTMMVTYGSILTGSWCCKCCHCVENIHGIHCIVCYWFMIMNIYVWGKLFISQRQQITCIFIPYPRLTTEVDALTSFIVLEREGTLSSRKMFFLQTFLRWNQISIDFHF